MNLCEASNRSGQDLNVFKKLDSKTPFMKTLLLELLHGKLTYCSIFSEKAFL